MALKLGVNLRTRTVTSNTTVNVFDDIINVDASLGDVNVTLFDATLAPGKSVIVNKIDETSGLVNIIGLQPINGVSSVVLFRQNESMDLASVAGAWLSIALGSQLSQNYSKNIQNEFLNADLMVNQRYVGNPGQNFNTGQVYYADRFATYVQGSTSKNVTVIQDFSDTPTIAEAGRFIPCSLSFTNIAGYTNSDPSDLVQPFFVYIEGFDYQRIHGLPVSLGFWFKTNVAGMYPISFNGPRSYVTSFPMAANTWTFVRKTVQLETTTSGYPSFDWHSPLSVLIGTATGSGQVTSQVNQWTSSNGFWAADAGSANTWNTTSGAVLKMAAPQLVVGTRVEPSLFTIRNSNFAAELESLQRYCWSPTYLYSTLGGAGAFMTGAVASTSVVCLGQFPKMMRTPPQPSPATSLVVLPSAGASQTITGNGGDTRTTNSGYFHALTCNNTGISSPIPCGIAAASSSAHIHWEAEF